MKKIGITGGIGSGKSVVCDIFKMLGVKVYNADSRSKYLLENDLIIRNSISEYFGQEIYKSGLPDRKLLASKVFNNPEALARLNSIVHPVVFADFNHWVEANSNEPYVVKEAAIMFESGANQHVDSVVLVYSQPELRLQRVMLRDKLQKEEVLSRMKNQMTDEEKMKLSDYIIYNDEEHSLIRQVVSLHHTFLSK
ncbi:MAG TPA: dephospho-CoA kinase [Bacteroidales bacterium]|nr:dephospho-CoA kinase [Bacteroidales bacterium]